MPKVLGHEAIVHDLERLSREGRLSHGYLFFGPSMVGKRTVARAFAHFLEKGAFAAPTAEEVLQDEKIVVRGEGNTIGIDAVREAKNFLWQRPNASPRRTLIIDDAELLTIEAQNALLRITEEPPVSSLLVLITSDPERILGTIRSRLQGISFGTVPEAAIAAWIDATKKTDATTFARRALGKPGLAWRLAHDEAFAAELARAEKFLRTPRAARKEFVKKLIEPDDFSLRRFLEAVIITLAWEKPAKANAALWHKTLALYGALADFPLNPRLQLMNL